MIVLKKTLMNQKQEYERKIAALEARLRLIEPFAEKGIKADQQWLRGYKWTNIGWLNKEGALRYKFHAVLKFFNECDGSTAAKLEKTLSYAHDLFYCNWQNNFSKDEKQKIIKSLENVTSLSPYTGDLIAVINNHKPFS